jgi:PAS domain S-box-containing protein
MDPQPTENKLQFHAHVLDSVEQSVIATDLEGRITCWNRNAEKLFGWPATEALGRKVMEVVVPVGLDGKAAGQTHVGEDASRCSSSVAGFIKISPNHG